MNQKTVVQTLTTISSAAPGKSENTSKQQQRHTDGRWQYYFNDQSASRVHGNDKIICRRRRLKRSLSRKL